MATKNPQEVAEKWASRLSGATDEIAKGIARVTEAPTQKAAQKKAKWLAGIQQAAANGKWERGLNAVSLADWQKAMREKGLSRVASGAQASKGKMQQFMSELLPYQEGLKADIENMPDLTIEDSINRMNAWTRGMFKFQRNK